MTLYNVHLYREMRLYFPGIEAITPEEAASIAADKLTEDAAYTEDCQGENLAALIDVVGDDQYEQSVTIDFEAERLRKAAPALLDALQAVDRWMRGYGTKTQREIHQEYVIPAIAKAPAERRPA